MKGARRQGCSIMDRSIEVGEKLGIGGKELIVAIYM